ncbi:MAG: response regulator [Alphaproteobacteria bacterium]|nr:response regulator [Alphaproteobacteria bacterium]
MNAKASRTVVLVVEDELLIRIAVAEYLRDVGHVVLEAAAAEDAIRHLNSGPVSLVFADVNLLGDMDGNALAEWVEATHPKVPVLMTSAHDTTCSRPFIAKPYEPTTLVKAVDKLLNEQ